MDDKLDQWQFITQYKAHKAWLKSGGKSGERLSAAVAANEFDTIAVNEHLQNAELVSATLSHSNFRGVDLEAINLSKARVKDAIFDYAKCNRAKFSQAILENTSFRDCRLSGTDFGNADLVHADLTRSDVSSANFVNANLENAVLTGANLRDTKFGDYLSNDNPTQTNCQGARFVEANCVHADFSNAKLDKASFKGADLRDALFANASLKGVNFSEAFMHASTSFKGADLEGADFKDIRIGKYGQFVSINLKGVKNFHLAKNVGN